MSSASSAVSTAASPSAPPPLRSAFYPSLYPRVKRLLASTRDPVASLSNLSALLYQSLQSTYGASAVNWCGFYLLRPIHYSDARDEHSEDVQSTLVLGPFQGQPAVTVIAPGHGVCGTAVVERRTQLVPDVHQHPNHIACDERSQSEVVVPVFEPNGEGEAGAPSGSRRLLAVLDIDCPTVNGFSEEDVVGLEYIASLLSGAVDWTHALHPITMHDSSQPRMALHSHASRSATHCIATQLRVDIRRCLICCTVRGRG